VESHVETPIAGIYKQGPIESPPVGCDPCDVSEPGPIVHVHVHVRLDISLVTNIDVSLGLHSLGHGNVSFACAIGHCHVARVTAGLRGCILHPVAADRRRRSCIGAYISISVLMNARPSHGAGRFRPCFRRRSRLSARCALLRSFRFDCRRIVSLLAPRRERQGETPNAY